MNSWYTIRARDSGADLLIYDEIGAYGISAKGFLAELGALPDEAAIDLRLNSPGGSVFDAVAIHNALSRHSGTVTVWIDGIAASAASYIAMAGDEIVMPENAFLMIHDPSGLVMGTAADMRDMAGTLDKIAASMTRGYAARAGKPEDEIAALMAAETWFDAAEALDVGLATRMADPVRIAASFDIGRFRNAPPELVEAVEAAEPEVAATASDIVEEDNDVVRRDDPAPAPDSATKVPVGNVDPLTPVYDPATPQRDVAGDNDVAPAANPAPAMPSADAAAQRATPDPQSTPEPGPHVSDENMPPSTVAAANSARDATAIRTEAIAHARAVVDLCRLAGQPQLAGRFLEEDASLDQVRDSLLDARADAEPQITPHHPQPGPNPTTRPWGDVIARTFKMKG